MKNLIPSRPQHSADDCDDASDGRRKMLSILLGGMGGVALAGCVERPGESSADASLGSVQQAATGTDLLWFDNVPALTASSGTTPFQVAVVDGYWAG